MSFYRVIGRGKYAVLLWLQDWVRSWILISSSSNIHASRRHMIWLLHNNFIGSPSCSRSILISREYVLMSHLQRDLLALLPRDVALMASGNGGHDSDSSAMGCHAEKWNEKWMRFAHPENMWDTTMMSQAKESQHAHSWNIGWLWKWQTTKIYFLHLAESVNDWDNGK